MEVRTKLGIVCGREDTSVLTGKTYFSFLGIPYAEPPVGDLRFKPPRPISKWKDVIKATKDGNMCSQIDPSKHETVIGDENCLFLNVYIKNPPSEENSLKPVMVYVHGGAFKTGSGRWSVVSPDYFISYDVVFVSMNYRLGVLGFLNLNIPECPGNVGIKDQLMAFQWVKNNIQEFGGDPNNITAIGTSAGAACVHLLAISPLSQGLFNRCILQSGTAFNPWAVAEDTTEAAFKLGRLLGYDGIDKKELLAVLKLADAKKLVSGTLALEQQLMKEHPHRCFPFQFLPTVEQIKDGCVIPCKPDTLLRQARHIPMILGLTEKEGLIMYQIMSPDIVHYLSKDFDSFVKENLRIEDASKIKQISTLIQEFYFNSEPIDSKNVSELTDLLSDYAFTTDFYRLASELPPTAVTYHYHFAYEGHFNNIKKISSRCYPSEVKGACHADELGYLFYMRTLYSKVPEFSDPDLKIIDTLCRFWTNFAKNGNPNDDSLRTKWLPVLQEPCYIEVSNNISMKMGRIAERRVQLWKQIRQILGAG